MCYDRQCSKEGLAGEIVDGDANGRKFSEDELRSLFTPCFESTSNVHDRSKCTCIRDGGMRKPDANGTLGC